MTKLAINGGEKTICAKAVWPIFEQKDEQAVIEVLRSGLWFRYEGPNNQKFEKRFAEYCGVKHALAVTNGTAALEIPLRAAGIGPGDEVIVPSYTFFSTASAVAYVGATPVFCDVAPDTYNMDLNHFQSLLNEKTKAVIPVHFAGFPVDMDRLISLSDQYKPMLIEDCAHAHGAWYKDKMLGSLGHAAAFSFQASKNLSSGEGGAILTDDEDLYKEMFSLHTCGRRMERPWYEHYVIGSNLRLSEFQAALLLTQFERLDEQTLQRRNNGTFLEKAIDEFPCFTKTQTPQDYSKRRTYHIFLFRYAPGLEGISREKFLEALLAEGVPAFGGYPIPLYRQPAFETISPPQSQGPYKELLLPGVEQCCRESIWIPQQCLLGDEENGRLIVKAIHKILENADELR